MSRLIIIAVIALSCCLGCASAPVNPGPAPQANSTAPPVNPDKNLQVTVTSIAAYLISERIISHLDDYLPPANQPRPKP